MDRLSTLVALSKRNIEVGAVKCRLCIDYEESSDLLTSCYFTTLIWQFVSNWYHISSIFAFTVRDLPQVHDTNLGFHKNKILNGIILTAYWCIWKTRNEVIFSNKPACLSKTIEDIKSLSFL
ncbi:uncharacterized protein LOC143593862 [Bidens hawaiensis]|uniref:uncharacterized protein LOC143593862 n=1 Tax=Bidens hawaiensis TaxID=980011 RepID=UPI004049DE6C